MTTITKTNHAKQLTMLVVSVAGVNQRVQDFIEFGVAHFVSEKGNGDASFLTNLVLELNDAKASMSKTVQRYIQAHTNLMFTDKENVLAFRKVGKKTEAKAEDLTVTWFDWSADSNKATPEIGIINAMKSLADRITSGIADNKAFKAFEVKELLEAKKLLNKALSVAQAELCTEKEATQEEVALVPQS